MIFGIASLAMLVVLGLVMVRALLGPTVFDRILAANTVGTLSVVLIALFGFLSKRPDFLDIALVYALINFIGTIAVTKYVKYSHLGHPVGDHHEGDL